MKHKYLIHHIVPNTMVHKDPLDRNKVARLFHVEQARIYS